MLLRKLKFLQFKKRATKACEELVDKYERHELLPSAKPDVMRNVKAMLDGLYDDKRVNFDDIEYERLPHAMLANITFDMLASGKYILAGMMTPTSCSYNLMDIYDSCLEYGVKIGEIDEKTREEEHHKLREAMRYVG